MKNRLPVILLVLGLLAPQALWGDAGILIPSNRKQPDPAVLSLREMIVDIRIDNGTARVSIRQIFASHHNAILEGNYIFALPARGTISDFAVWDGLTRIPGVILERRRAQELYEQIKLQSIDPGLLQMGEYGAAEARRSSVFTVKVVPIPAYGTKRLEIEYHETLPVENFQSLFALPLRPDVYAAQVAGRLKLTFELISEHPLDDFEVIGTAYPLRIEERTSNLIRGSFSGENVTFSEDFAVRYSVRNAGKDSLKLITFRDPAQHTPDPTVIAPVVDEDVPGFFQATALLQTGQAETARASGPSRAIIALMDTSLSMQWDKLERSFQALETLLRTLNPEDRFNVLLFNNEVESFAPKPVPASISKVENALSFVRRSYIRGGTDLQKALATGLAQAASEQGEVYLVLIGDGNATRGTIHAGKLSNWVKAKWEALPETRRPHFYVFAVGDDANLPFLRMATRNRGLLEQVRSTEPIEFKLKSFLAKIGRSPVQELSLQASPSGNFDLVYPLEETVYPGSAASWVGQYRNPLASAKFEASGIRQGRPFSAGASIPLPKKALDHPHLPRTWARARVDALLEKIEREGEDRETIEEIIRLARKYKFVTPYTSFLAAPRALLRPRVIRPGDPVLRVRTDPSIRSVIAMFPFGLVKKLRYLPGEDIWQTRFLAPSDMGDGSHEVRLILRDDRGNAYREKKSFVIISKPPVVRVTLEKERFRPGETVALRVGASQTTRTIIARMYGIAPVNIRWNSGAKTNTGSFVIPASLPVGRYQLTVTAEDAAHNIGSQEVWVEVVP